MASIQDQLARQDWEPVPGDHLIGTITAIKIRMSKAREGKDPQPYPVLLIREDGQDGKDGREFIVTQAALVASDIIAHGPSVGERVGIRFDGPKENRNGDTYERYVIAWEKEDETVPDWDAMRANRNITAKTRPAPASADDGPPPPGEPLPDDSEPPEDF